MDHKRDMCTLCGQAGHNSSQCPAERWPRWIRSVAHWISLALLAIAFGVVPVLMGIRL